MSVTSIPSLYLHQELVGERIRVLHQEAAEYRLASRIQSVQRARRRAERASARLRHALSRV
jgi:hypothetical protein